MGRLNRRLLLWAVLALFLMVWSGSGLACLEDGDDAATNPGDPVDYPPTCQIRGSSADAFQASEEALEPTPGILSGFWMILMAMAFQLAL